MAIAAVLLPGQAVGQEVQVPLDEAGRVVEVDRELARRLGLFLQDYPQLETVRLFRTDTEFVLEIGFHRDGRAARYRVPMTGAAVQELRSRVSRALVANAPDVTLDQDGRFLLLGTTTALGLGFYGWAVPSYLDIDSGRGVLATYMLTAGASFVLPYLYTRSRPVTYGMANAGLWGATRGISHGIALVNALDTMPEFGTSVGIATGFSLVEGLAAYRWAEDTGMGTGRIHTIANFGDFGPGLAGELLMLTRTSGRRTIYGSLLAGSAVGVAAGAWIAPSLDYTWGDAEIQRAGYLLGGANGGVVFDWIFGQDTEANDIRFLGGLLLAGNVGGTYLAHQLLEDRDFSVGEGILVDLGTAAGGLLGVGLAVLIGPEQIDDPTTIFTLGAVGANLGFLATFNGLADNARQRALDPKPAASRLAGPRLRFDVNPGALALLAAGGQADHRAGVPVFSLQYRF